MEVTCIRVQKLGSLRVLEQKKETEQNEKDMQNDVFPENEGEGKTIAQRNVVERWKDQRAAIIEFVVSHTSMKKGLWTPLKSANKEIPRITQSPIEYSVDQRCEQILVLVLDREIKLTLRGREKGKGKKVSRSAIFGLTFLSLF